MSNSTAAPVPLKIIIQSFENNGNLFAAIGLAEALSARGHEVVFVVSEVHRGKFIKLGFGEKLLSLDASKPIPSSPIKLTAEQFARNGLLSGVSSFEKIKLHNTGESNFLQTLCDNLVHFDAQIEAAIEPDCNLIICNQFLTPPAILRANIPWIYQYPCNPLAMYRSEKLPPFYSGFSVASDPSTWREYRQYLDSEYVERFNRYQRQLNARCNYEPLNKLDKRDDDTGYFAKSPYLNLYDFPSELDYDDIAPRPANCVQFEAFFRNVPTEPFTLPEGFFKSGEKLIYVSMGSYGGIDVELMKRIVSVLGSTSHKYIVSKGLRAKEYELPKNCYGEAFLPQTRILPLVDLVITHGGNNTVTETFSLGKPMIVLPLFFDQFDNAQRIQDMGYGIRLEPYEFTDLQLRKSIERMLGDLELQEKCRRAAERIANSDTEAKACQRIEQMHQQFKSSRESGN